MKNKVRLLSFMLFFIYSSNVLFACVTCGCSRKNWVSYIFDIDTTAAVRVVNIPDNSVATAITFQVSPISEGSALAITPDAKTVYVSNPELDTISVIDVVSNKNIGEIFLELGSFPTGLAISPDGETLYVANNLANNVSCIDLYSYEITSIPVGTLPDSIVITPDGSTAYISNNSSDDVTVIDLTDNSWRTTISLETGDGPASMAITPDGTTIYVANHKSNSVKLIDVATNTLLPITVNTGIAPHDIAITPDGKMAFITNSCSNSVTPIDLTSNTPLSDITVDAITPFCVAITPDNQTAYVTDASSGLLTPIDIPTLTAGESAIVGNRLLSIVITPDQGPIASFTSYADDEGFHFDASNSISPLGTIVTYAWDFGDGEYVWTSSPFIDHSYSDSGTYKVTLTVTNSGGTSTTQTFTGQAVSNNGGPIAAESEILEVIVI